MLGGCVAVGSKLRGEASMHCAGSKPCYDALPCSYMWHEPMNAIPAKGRSTAAGARVGR